MTVRIDLTKEVKASIQRVLDYFMNVESCLIFIQNILRMSTLLIRKKERIIVSNLSKKVHFMARKLHRLIGSLGLAMRGYIRIEIIDGNGKGSVTTIRCQEISPGNTQIRLQGELHYGILEKLLSRSIHGITEKTLKEDIRNLEQK